MSLFKDMIFFDMGRKLLLILFFLVVFGLPVGWYLFLQVFGENQFALPSLGEWEYACQPMDHRATLMIESGCFDDYPNQLNRLKSKLENQKQIDLQEVDQCKLAFPIYLVDENKNIRGKYGVNREETDRLLAEIDIYILNQENE